MIDATAEGEGGGERRLTDEEIVAHSISFLLAGYETTANTLAYTSYLLALNPEIQEKLQATIDEYFENNSVSVEWNTTLVLLLHLLISGVNNDVKSGKRKEHAVTTQDVKIFLHSSTY